MQIELRTALQRRGDATRQLLLDEATRQFSELGFRATSLNSIAAASGLGNAGALHHFPSKEKLYRAVLERLSSELASGMKAILGQHASPAERLRAVIRYHIAGVIKNPQHSRLILRELMDNVGRVEQAKSLPLARHVASFCRLIEEAQATGAAASGSAIVLLAQFLGSLSYALVVRPTFARMGIEQAVDERRWIEAVARAAERALLGDGAAADDDMPIAAHRRAKARHGNTSRVSLAGSHQEESQ